MKCYLIGILIVFLLISCENEDGNETVISKNNTAKSHRTGDNCMDCHIQGGDGEGWFTVAGSLFDDTPEKTYINGTVKLTTESDGGGEIVHTIEADNNGNFFTTETIHFSNGLYVGVYGMNGEKTIYVFKDNYRSL
jgi:hypothetical protein